MPRAQRYMLLAVLFTIMLLAMLVVGLLAACVMLYPDMARAGLHP